MNQLFLCGSESLLTRDDMWLPYIPVILIGYFQFTSSRFLPICIYIKHISIHHSTSLLRTFPSTKEHTYASSQCPCNNHTSHRLFQSNIAIIIICNIIICQRRTLSILRPTLVIILILSLLLLLPLLSVSSFLLLSVSFSIYSSFTIRWLFQSLTLNCDDTNCINISPRASRTSTASSCTTLTVSEDTTNGLNLFTIWKFIGCGDGIEASSAWLLGSNKLPFRIACIFCIPKIEVIFTTISPGIYFDRDLDFFSRLKSVPTQCFQLDSFNGLIIFVCTPISINTIIHGVGRV
mmetsp:Transcript_26754/g.34300  ORF Transcript_26754/g.34300 Transcript_26754/m.34300 type:complete len:292 (+) Transcript_26754:619-1494(+)